MELVCVNIDTATILKEIGFNIDCRSYYVNNTSRLISSSTDNHNKYSFCASAPEQYLARKFLKLKHNILIEISYFPIEDDDENLKEILHEVEVYDIENNKFELLYNDGGFKEEEEALEKAIFNTCKIIKDRIKEKEIAEKRERTFNIHTEEEQKETTAIRKSLIL